MAGNAFGIPGLSLPSLSLGSDWNVNLAGSGNALQSASSMPWLLILGAVAVGVVLWKN